MRNDNIHRQHNITVSTELVMGQLLGQCNIAITPALEIDIAMRHDLLFMLEAVLKVGGADILRLRFG